VAEVRRRARGGPSRRADQISYKAPGSAVTSSVIRRLFSVQGPSMDVETPETAGILMIPVGGLCQPTKAPLAGLRARMWPDWRACARSRDANEKGDKYHGIGSAAIQPVAMMECQAAAIAATEPSNVGPRHARGRGRAMFEIGPCCRHAGRGRRFTFTTKACKRPRPSAGAEQLRPAPMRHGWPPYDPDGQPGPSRRCPL